MFFCWKHWSTDVFWNVICLLVWISCIQSEPNCGQADVLNAVCSRCEKECHTCFADVVSMIIALSTISYRRVYWTSWDMNSRWNETRVGQCTQAFCTSCDLLVCWICGCSSGGCVDLNLLCSLVSQWTFRRNISHAFSGSKSMHETSIKLGSFCQTRWRCIPEDRTIRSSCLAAFPGEEKNCFSNNVCLSIRMCLYPHFEKCV